jgi:hypothetical protein
MIPNNKNSAPSFPYGINFDVCRRPKNLGKFYYATRTIVSNILYI